MPAHPPSQKPLEQHHGDEGEAGDQADAGSRGVLEGLGEELHEDHGEHHGRDMGAADRPSSPSTRRPKQWGRALTGVRGRTSTRRLATGVGANTTRLDS